MSAGWRGLLHLGCHRGRGAGRVLSWAFTLVGVEARSLGARTILDYAPRKHQAYRRFDFLLNSDTWLLAAPGTPGPLLSVTVGRWGGEAQSTHYLTRGRRGLVCPQDAGAGLSLASEVCLNTTGPVTWQSWPHSWRAAALEAPAAKPGPLRGMPSPFGGRGCG